MAKIYLITHGDRQNGPDPGHTRAGIEKIRSLPLPEGVGLVVSGTGKRFLETLDVVLKKFPWNINPAVRYSTFCGGCEGFDGDEVVLSDRRVNYAEMYIGLSHGPFDLWQFVAVFADMPCDVILCAGQELMSALGLKAIHKRGSLYELDLAGRTGELIS